ncbi:MAG: NADH-quinone oxidoreductase subunit C [Candidatus Diapherotrites archaeon]|nr:NADH-quinone oxidoreductase subunit C [Candidatus Diapherotrites archaeon]
MKKTAVKKESKIAADKKGPSLKNEAKISAEIKKLLGETVSGIEVQRARRIFIEAKAKGIKKVLSALKEKMDCTHLSAISCIDETDSFGIIYHLWSGEGSMISVKTKIPRAKPEIETVTDIFPSANLFERENHDLFGVEPIGHPDLRRLMLNEDWPEGEFPLRKDWAKGEKKYYGGVKNARL